MSDIFHTPQEAIDVALANLPMGNLPPGADGTERLRPGPTQIPYRKAAVELYNLGGLDFVRQEGDGERIVYTSLAAAGGAHPQPRLCRMTLFRRELGGWTACIFNTFGALVAKLVFPLGKRGDCELAARRACAAIVARAFHKQRSQIRWRENRKARRAAASPTATDLTQRNREAESAEPIGVRGSAPDEKNSATSASPRLCVKQKTESTEAEAAR